MAMATGCQKPLGGPGPACGGAAAAPRYLQCPAMFPPDTMPPTMAALHLATPATGTTAVLSLHRQGRETAWHALPGRRVSKIAIRRGGKAPNGHLLPGPLDSDGERPEGGHLVGTEEGGGPGNAGAAMGLDDEAGALSGRKEEEGGELALPGGANEGRQVVHIGGGGCSRRTRHPEDHRVVRDHPNEGGGGPPHADAAQQQPDDGCAATE